MQFPQQPQSMLCKIAFLIIALVGNVSCIRNENDGNDEQKHISTKLKNFFPSEPLHEVTPNLGQTPQPQISARVTNGGFRPSQMLEFTPSDVMQGNAQRYPPSYLEPNYKHQLPITLSNLNPQQSASDKQFSFPDDGHHYQPNTYTHAQIPTTPVVSYLDPFTQQNYQYTPKPTMPTYIQYQREQPQEQGDQAYTVQSSLLVGSHSPQRPPHDEVYLKRPGYVFDESPSTIYRRPAATTPTSATSNKISYDSHDYPPPSYAAQQTSNFKPQPVQQSPQRPLYNRQDINVNRPSSSIQQRPPPPSPPQPQPIPQYSTSSNYANNFGNYLQRPPKYPSSHSNYPSQSQSQSQSQYEPTQFQYESLSQQHQQQQQPGHNYYEYQIGEIPPQQKQEFNYRPAPAPAYRPPYHQQQQQQQQHQQQSGAGGLATLASLYAPQFTNLLLGGGGSASTASSPLGSLLGAFTSAQQSTGQHHSTTRPPNTQLIKALENIARNDDLQCVPKVLCQMIAGQTLRGQLPGFITSPAITNFLAGFPVASPALIYGRAALLGISGGERSCIQTYEKCPKNEMEIIHYLNNHRGGFFKFFSEPEEQPALAEQSESGGGSFFSILSALTGGGGGQGQGLGQVTRTTPRPVARPTQRPSTDIADGIGSFFTRVLSEYLNGVEYQRRRRRRSVLPTEIKRNIQTDNGRLMPLDFHDEEDDLDTQTPVKFQDDEEAEAAKAHTELIGVLQFPEDGEGEGRILHFKNIESDEHNDNNGAVRFPDASPEVQRDSKRNVIFEFNRDAAQRKLRFPQEQDEGERQAKKLQLMEAWAPVLPNGLGIDDYGVEKRRGKRIVFKDTNEQLEDFDERLRKEQLHEEAERFPEEQLREAEYREEQLREEQVHEEAERYREEQLREPEYREEQLREHHAPNAVYKEAAPPQRGARVIFPDHYERHIRKGKILNRPTYAPTYDYNNRVEEKEQPFVVSNEHRPSSYNRLETSTDYQTNEQSSQQQSFMNHGEYMPGNTVRFSDSNDVPNYNALYNYPNANYISDNRYSSAYQPTSTRRPKQEDDKNIYVTNSQGVTEYYIRPDGRKVYLGSS